MCLTLTTAQTNTPTNKLNRSRAGWRPRDAETLIVLRNRCLVTTGADECVVDVCVCVPLFTFILRYGCVHGRVCVHMLLCACVPVQKRERVSVWRIAGYNQVICLLIPKSLCILFLVIDAPKLFWHSSFFADMITHTPPLPPKASTIAVHLTERPPQPKEEEERGRAKGAGGGRGTEKETGRGKHKTC